MIDLAPEGWTGIGQDDGGSIEWTLIPGEDISGETRCGVLNTGEC